MKTRVQKSEEIEEGKKLLSGAATLIFTDFSRTPAEEIRRLRRSLKDIGAAFKVLKKRLLRIVLKENQIDFDPKSFESQFGTVFAPGEISEPASLLYKFSKGKEFKILGGYDLKEKTSLEAEKIKLIGQLPSREVLLAQVVGAIVAPIKAFLYVLSQKSKMVDNK